ncbi:RHS repeat domain-containing protein [Burkholderia sp. AU6039]|uniref:RHS repeat domain-containing protein n=1 Tax=Burkholderia sp. AU6039 TaxID=2015344 RepID=UPI002795E9AE|nr:RHS repeat-associated core domain-containing protein [Burkholderia sp. AU6039]
MEVLTGTPKYEEPEAHPEVTRYRYDGSHQLVAIEHVDGARSEYEYDALGRRVAKHHTQAGGARQTTLFMWDGDWMMQEVRTGCTSHEDQAVTYVPHPDHEGPLTRLAEGQAWHYVTDHLGTPQELYDEQREVVWAADLSAYGRSARTLAHGVDNPIRFPGQYYDQESGLHYNRFRYYDPLVGRYINQDPIGLDGGPNLYDYSYSAPTIAYDPTGLFVPLLLVAAEFGRRALLGAGVELGMQGGKQVLGQVWSNWVHGRPLTDIDWDCVKVNWREVGFSAAVGIVAPGMGGALKSVSRSASAIRKISSQAANTTGRKLKLQERINSHKSSIKRDLAVQGVWLGLKQAGKCVFGEEKVCEE